MIRMFGLSDCAATSADAANKPNRAKVLMADFLGKRGMIESSKKTETE
jgi:hypothetical protein